MPCFEQTDRKMKKVLLTISVCVAVMSSSFAQVQTAQEYIMKYKDLAIREMRRMGVPAAITLAQGLLETENGNSELFKNSNNHFGIKCKAEWTAATYAHDDDLKGECFRVYESDEASYRDHSNFLRSRSWYGFLFNLDPLDYKAWAYGLKKAGYATNPRYPEVLIHSIEQYHLQQYSLAALDDTSQFIDTYAIDSAANANDSTDDNDSTAMATNSPDNTILVINGSRCKYESKGTSLLAIATENNINLNSLLLYNDLTDDGILNKDQLIFLEKKAKTGDQRFYILQKGETLYDVAQKNGIQLQYLLFYNGLREYDNVAAGTKIYLQPQAVPTSSVEPVKKIYEVQPSEGLYSIARKNGITVQQIRDWNHLQSDSLMVGQQLIISQ
jgi:LysM repeat protein